MMRRRARPFHALLAATAAVVGGLALSTGGAGAAAGVSGKSVGLEFCTQQNPFCAGWIKTFTAVMAKHGVKVTTLTSNFDPAVDAQNMSTLIADKPNLIVITPSDPSAIVPSLARAKAAGIPVINAIGRLTKAGIPLVVSSVLTNNKELGTYAAQNIVAGLKAEGVTKGNVVAETGTATQLIVQDRVAAFKAAMAKYPQFKIVAVQDTNWDQATSDTTFQELAAKYKSKGGIQAAYGMADNQAVGIIQGAQQAGLKVGLSKKGLIVTGSNCLSVGIGAIRAGTEYGTATQAPGPEATLAAKTALSVLEGKKVAATVNVPEFRITKANVSKFAGECTF
jgi:ABC-type sugar transport system substrate-binding protein